MLPLQGIRVLDFGRYIAGPYCAMLLADFGADVIRIERLEGGEDRYLAPVTETGEGPLFLALNRNKRSLALDLNQPSAREIQRRLIATADVIIANLPLDVLHKLELDHASLIAIKPDIILAQISAFGADGPYATRAGFDPVAQAMSGAMKVTGFPGPPVRSVVNFADYGTALHAAFGVMVALFERKATGRGQVVEASLLTTGVTFMQALLAERDAIGADRRQQGNTGYHAAPADTYQTQDGWIIIQAIGQPMFKRWARMVKRPELIDDPRLVDDLARANHHEIINAAMGEWAINHTNESALAALEQARIPAAPVYDFDQTLNDSHIRERGLLRPMSYPDGAKPTLLADTAVRLSGTPGSVRHRAPHCGEHTDEILSELGYSAEDIALFQKA